jgi:hypothetical protein
MQPLKATGSYLIKQQIEISKYSFPKMIFVCTIDYRNWSKKRGGAGENRTPNLLNANETSYH